MEKLFETKFKYDFSEYKKMMYVISSKNSNDQYRYIKFIIWMFMLVIISYLLNLGVAIISSILTLAFMMIIFVLLSKKSIQISYDSHTLIKEVTLEYSFFDEYLEIKTSQTYEKIYYYQIYNAIETDTNYYLLISSVSAYCLLKKDIKKERAFNKFLKSKVTKYLELNKKKS